MKRVWTGVLFGCGGERMTVARDAPAGPSLATLDRLTSKAYRGGPA